MPSEYGWVLVRGDPTCGGRPAPSNRELTASAVAHLCRALGGIRTPNLLIRSQMLYPLSYERSSSASDLRGRLPSAYRGRNLMAAPRSPRRFRHLGGRESTERGSDRRRVAAGRARFSARLRTSPPPRSANARMPTPSRHSAKSTTSSPARSSRQSCTMPTYAKKSRAAASTATTTSVRPKVTSP